MTSTTSTEGLPIEVRGLTKRFGSVHAVEDLSFTVRPGAVTGFLGPNGAGKTTTLRALLGLVQADEGTATIGGRAYADIPQPAAVVGAALEAASFHPGRSARNHLRVLAPLLGVGDGRCDEVLALVGLADVADRKAGGFSLGMRQRLGLAATLLGDPPVLILDEPANGLDPQGIVWLRDLLRHLAREGRTVLVSSHVLAEVEATVDDVVVIAEGRMVHASSLQGLVALSRRHVRVVGPDRSALGRMLEQEGWTFAEQDGGFSVEGVAAPQVGSAAFAAGIELHELSLRGGNLEETFLALVRGDIEGSVA